MEQYRGYTVSDIDPQRGIVTFSNDEKISIGEVRGDVSEKDLRRVQIRETIRSHFDKERDLFSRGIKTLSLFFIDKVAKYREYDEDGNEVNSEYGEIFEQEYTDILNETLTLYNTPYEQYLRGIDPHETHAGYFSIDKKGRKVDSSLRRGSDESDDVSAYDLIMKDKERLLSFDNPVRFIFSHSALREGWDNPNVFQICTLKHGGSSPAQKRQEVGRGLRLCVNQNGDRMDYDVLGNQVQEINQLTVIAADGYTQFVTDLQRGIRDDLYDRPTQATKEYFAGKTLIINNQEITITKEQANAIHRYLIRNEYVDDADHVTDAYRTDYANQTLAPLPDALADIADGVHALIRSVFDESALKDMIRKGGKPVPPKNELNEKFKSPDFQALWNLINRKYTYFVEYDSAELIRAAIQRINERASLFSSKLRYVNTTGKQVQDMSVEGLNRGDSFETTKSHTETLKHFTRSSVPYDLIGKVAEGTRLTRRSVTAILKGIDSDIFNTFQENPEDFIDKVVRLINEPKAETIVTRLTYNRTNGRFSKEIFNVDKHTDFSKAILTAKSVQDYVFTDGYAIDGNNNEARFVNALEGAEEVIVYAKLPRGFYIPTPFGKYTPDWAIAFDKEKVKYIYFVAETKGSMSDADLREVEADKIKCARQLFGTFSTEDIRYDTVDSYERLRDVVFGKD